MDEIDYFVFLVKLRKSSLLILVQVCNTFPVNSFGKVKSVKGGGVTDLYTGVRRVAVLPVYLPGTQVLFLDTYLKTSHEKRQVVNNLRTVETLLSIPSMICSVYYKGCRGVGGVGGG